MWLCGHQAYEKLTVKNFNRGDCMIKVDGEGWHDADMRRDTL